MNLADFDPSKIAACVDIFEKAVYWLTDWTKLSSKRSNVKKN